MAGPQVVENAVGTHAIAHLAAMKAWYILGCTKPLALRPSCNLPPRLPRKVSLHRLCVSWVSQRKAKFGLKENMGEAKEDDHVSHTT